MQSVQKYREGFGFSGCCASRLVSAIASFLLICSCNHSSEEKAATPAITDAPKLARVDAPATIPNTTSAEPILRIPKPRRPTVGEEVSIGYWSYTVHDVGWTSIIGNGLSGQANAAFLVVDVTARNNDSTSSNLPPFYLVDTAGRKYDHSPAGSFSAGFFGPLDKLNPGVSKRGLIAFDVPPDRQYALLVSGGFESGSHTTIGLSVPETPLSKATPETTPARALQSYGPILLRKVEPQSSEEARNTLYKGDIRASVEIDEHGRVSSVRVLDSPGLGLEDKIVSALLQWQFRPAMKDGVVIHASEIVTVSVRCDAVLDAQGLMTFQCATGSTL